LAKRSAQTKILIAIVHLCLGRLELEKENFQLAIKRKIHNGLNRRRKERIFVWFLVVET